jgi:hypothetical protein
VSDWLKIPWAGASLTSPSRRVLLSPVGLAVLGGPRRYLFRAIRLDGRTAVVPCNRLRRRFWRLRIAEVAMFAIAFVPVFVSEGMRAQASTCRLR